MLTFSTVAGSVRRAVRHQAEAARRRRDFRFLLTLSDRELSDIGVTRDELPNLFRR